MLGPLLARCGQAKVALPGGDAIGSRGLDFHIAGPEQARRRACAASTATCVAEAAQLAGAAVWLDFPSVGATENLLMAAVLAKGTTMIDNAAREPEIVDLCQFLAEMGAQHRRHRHVDAGDRGRRAAAPRPTHATVPDRIVAGTYAVAAVMTRGDVLVRGGRAEHLEIALDKLVQAGATVERRAGRLPGRAWTAGRGRSTSSRCPTRASRPTCSRMVLALNAVTEGTAMMTENVFEARWMFVNELAGSAPTSAPTATTRSCAVGSGCRGRPSLRHDIRAGAALVLAGLVAEGVTEVGEVYHVDRGYQGFVEQLRALGADVRRETVTDRPPRLSAGCGRR